MDARVHTERRARGHGKQKSAITANESNCMPQDSISWAGGFRKWGKEEKICSWPKRWKDKRTTCEKSHQGEHSNSDESVDTNINSPDHAGWRSEERRGAKEWRR